MGEISEALRRARDEREAERESGSEPLQRARVHPLPPEGFADAEAPASKVEISREKQATWVPRAVLVEPRGPVAERFRHLAIRVRAELERRQPPILLVTSAVPGDGKTTASCNLALALSSIASGRRIALLDLDLRRPSLARVLGMNHPVGMEEVLAGRVPLAAARVGTDLPALDVYPVGRADGEAHELLSGPALPTVLRDLTRRYAMVVCDSPPVIPVPDAPLIAEYASSCLLVARAGATRRSAFREMLELLPRQKVLGVFLNDAAAAQRKYYGYYYGEEEEQ